MSSSVEDLAETPSTAARARRERLILRLIAAVIAVIAFGQYVATLAPSVVEGDPSELQVLVARLGIPHGTSYPLYVWLGHLFMALPLGHDPAYRLNLFSAVGGAAAVFVMFFVTFELGVARAWWARGVGAGVAAALVAYSHTFWSIAIVAEEYTLHVLLALSAVYLLLRWMRVGKPGLLIGAFAILGGMFGNHSMTLGLLPGAAVFVLLRGRPSRELWRTLGVALLAGTLALLVCNVLLFYLLWRRAVPFDHWQWILSCPQYFELPDDARERFWYAWWYEVTCRQFQRELTGATLALRLEQLRALPHRIAAEYFPVAAALSLVGWALLWRRWRENVLVTLICVTHVCLVSSLAVTVKSHIYLLVATFLAAACTGLAVSWIGEAVARWALGPEVGRPRALPAALAFTIAMTVALAVANQRSRSWYLAAMVEEKSAFVKSAVLPRLGARPDGERNTAVHDTARRAIAGLPPDAIVFTSWHIHYALEYVARIERGIESMTVLECYPSGIGRREFVWDYLPLIRDPGRSRPMFFVEASPPHLDGFRVLRRSDTTGEVVRVDGK